MKTNPSSIIVPAHESALAKQGVFTENVAAVDRVGSLFGELAERLQHGGDIAAALIPWFCDRLQSDKSRKDYLAALKGFLGRLSEFGIHPLSVTGDTVRLYKESLTQAGYRPATVAQHLSVIRGTYRELGKRGLVPWETVGDIQAVQAPRVEKNTTPHLSEDEARRLLHAPDTRTLIGARDHALLFTYFKTACRCSAIARCRVGDLEWTDHELYLVVTEKGKRERRLALLEAAGAVRRWMQMAEISGEQDSPLFPAMAPNGFDVTRRMLNRRTILNIVKKYATIAGLEAERHGRRGIGVHSLRKTAGMSALKHGAKVEQVQAWLGHADIRTTQEYIVYKDEDAEEAARHCQIR